VVDGKIMEEEPIPETTAQTDPFVEINELLQVTSAGDKDSHFSRVNNILEGQIVIAWPTNRGIRMPLRAEQKIELVFVRNMVPFGFSGTILEASIDPLPQVTVRPTSAAKKVQRRQNFRVKCMMPVQIDGSIPDGSGDSDVMQPLSIKCVTYDLSAGGLSIRNATRIPESTLVEVKLKLTDGAADIRIPARVAYSGSVSSNSVLYHMGIDFLAISDWEQARIVRFLYQIQLKGLRL
jgi:c-di-GMP-binding flagellar brake protein YcgR